MKMITKRFSGRSLEARDITFSWDHTSLQQIFLNSALKFAIFLAAIFVLQSTPVERILRNVWKAPPEGGSSN